MEHKNRKYPRLKEYDYSLPGYYYVTIHNENNAPLLSLIEPGNIHQRASVRLTQVGEIAMKELQTLESRYPYRWTKHCGGGKPPPYDVNWREPYDT